MKAYLFIGGYTIQYENQEEAVKKFDSVLSELDYLSSITIKDGEGVLIFSVDVSREESPVFYHKAVFITKEKILANKLEVVCNED